MEHQRLGFLLISGFIAAAAVLLSPYITSDSFAPVYEEQAESEEELSVAAREVPAAPVRQPPADVSRGRVSELDRLLDRK